MHPARTAKRLVANRTPVNPRSDRSNNLDRPSRRSTRYLRRIVRSGYRVIFADPATAQVFREFVIAHAGIWFRCLPRRMARIAAEQAVRRFHRSTTRDRARSEFQSLLHAMLARAALGTNGKPWSRKELVAKAGLTWGTFHRALSGQLELKTWLPRLRSAAERL